MLACSRWCLRLVLIESDWNLKPFGIIVHRLKGRRINRIRLEFKVRRHTCSKIFCSSINRIRLEFKEKEAEAAGIKALAVLIESDWNLKIVKIICNLFCCYVLIESDWNLKQKVEAYAVGSETGINRIRLEFKGVVEVC